MLRIGDAERCYAIPVCYAPAETDPDLGATSDTATTRTRTQVRACMHAPHDRERHRAINPTHTRLKRTAAVLASPPRRLYPCNTRTHTAVPAIRLLFPASRCVADHILHYCRHAAGTVPPLLESEPFAWLSIGGIIPLY